MIWKNRPNLNELNQLCQHCAVGYLAIEFTAFGEDWLEASVPVDHRTTQPFGLLHGGISATLAETLGSAAAMLSCEPQQIPVGTELNISHLKGIHHGKATAKATPLHLGKKHQVWHIDLFNDQQERCATARLRVELISKDR